MLNAEKQLIQELSAEKDWLKDGAKQCSLTLVIMVTERTQTVKIMHSVPPPSATTRDTLVIKNTQWLVRNCAEDIQIAALDLMKTYFGYTAQLEMLAVLEKRTRCHSA